ncbi:MAG TPA: hypothetical protein VGF24_37050 [Vicinamibacterales bacterium]
MRQTETIFVGVVALLVTIGGPVVLGLTGAIRDRRSRGSVTLDASPRDWRLTINSALLYCFAFNLVFFIQELFLVVPKALTPGLRPTLFHNNHHWEGANPLASLFQGTGALAILLTAGAFAVWLTRFPPRSTTLRLFVIWMTFHGFFQSLPQVVVGAILPQNDVGMAMDFLRFTPAAKASAALVALAAIVILAIWLIPPLLELAQHSEDLDSVVRRTRFVSRVATIPALAAIPLIILFRVPGTIDQVVIVPVAVTVIGISWIQAVAWRVTTARIGHASPARSIRYPCVAVVALFLVFQLILRPGINFF